MGQQVDPHPQRFERADCLADDGWHAVPVQRQGEREAAWSGTGDDDGLRHEPHSFFGCLPPTIATRLDDSRLRDGTDRAVMRDKLRRCPVDGCGEVAAI